jgi:hypothetical protein
MRLTKRQGFRIDISSSGRRGARNRKEVPKIFLVDPAAAERGCGASMLQLEAPTPLAIGRCDGHAILDRKSCLARARRPAVPTTSVLAVAPVL